jgi:uncharacterized damage-inducible protein DinB
MSATAAILQELEQEAATTRRVLERVPSDKLGWKPHEKSMSLGTLAMHVATAPGAISDWAIEDTTKFSGEGGAPDPKSTAEILSAHDDGLTKAKNNLSTLGDAGLGMMWSMQTPDGKTVLTMPKSALVRSIVMNHVYHHRGQLSVYLRLLNVPVPSIYGPSADEAPRGMA